jgi:hypothetical protein
MTQELTELRNSIIAGRYQDALEIIDELEGMSKQDILRKIESFLIRLLIHLLKNQLEQRLTNSWAASLRSSVLEIQRLNLKDNKTTYYVKQNDWITLLEDVIEIAIRDASIEVFNGEYNSFQITDLVKRNELIILAQNLLNLTYDYSRKELPAVIDNYLIQLPGGKDWREGKPR